MLSTTADHALRAVLFLATQEKARVVSVEEIAHAIGAPRNYLGKTLNALAKSGVLNSSRGPNGGFILARSANRLSVAQIVDLFDSPVQQSRCLLGDRPCNANEPCIAHFRWSSISQARRAPLTATTIADLVAVD
jgi:Rrf2 family protein